MVREGEIKGRAVFQAALLSRPEGDEPRIGRFSAREIRDYGGRNLEEFEECSRGN